ncbi:MAG: dTDP-D-glucose 4,6-dehydratase [Candidatus Peregrinibacteria bacterium Greene0416_62]|nr:MAG: dTDP-D-glucose 4,6-dehydratase [Candidatus Peregrinibacteria bacterium Greene0416_62]TSD00423.1 MAG: dTDP-D-glucose 4,6-dehydratase [Candidatus Peregrinibacteria bacterium Greene1014_49]
MPKRILITGGVGFIGVNAAERFLKEGWEVEIFDNFSRRGVELNERYLQGVTNAKNLTIHRGDVRRDQDLLVQLCEQADVVLHLAAQVAVTTSVTDPRTDFDVNALGTFNVLEAVRASSKKPMVIYASTNKVYGSLEHLSVVEEKNRYALGGGLRAVDESQPLDFHSPYGCSKGAADQYVRDYSRIYGLKTIVFRQSCIYGTRQLGIEDQGWVAWFMIAAMFKRPVTLYGNGKQVRDLLFVEDLVEAYVQAIAHIDKCSGQAYNLGGGSENALSLLEFFAILEKDFGQKLSPAHSPERPGDQPIFIADNGKFSADSGWRAKTGVREGLKKLNDWLQENKPMLQEFYK